MDFRLRTYPRGEIDVGNPGLQKRPGHKPKQLTERDALLSNEAPHLDVEVDLEENDEEFDSQEAPPSGQWGKITSKFQKCCCPPRSYYARTIEYNAGTTTIVMKENNLPRNELRNQKYSFFGFFPVVLYEQFKIFFNLYFLIVALSQFIPALKIVFVLTITITKEAYDDIQRWKRDREANSQQFQRLTSTGAYETIPSADIQVGDFILLEKNHRVPADMVLVRTSDKSGACYIRTDQLDGETDWKLRRAVSSTQGLPSDEALITTRYSLFANKPKKDIYSFEGTLQQLTDQKHSESLSLENTLWMNTVLAAGSAIGCVIYTGPETRSVMNTSHPETKIGLLDQELNSLAKENSLKNTLFSYNIKKVLFAMVVALSFVMVALNGFKAGWLIDMFRFSLLFSAIVPIRVNLDMGKTLYSLWIMKDEQIEGTIVRTSTIPEELGRISYLLTDKTGTLTQNEMIFKRLHLGSIAFSRETVADIRSILENSFRGTKMPESHVFSNKKAMQSEKDVRRIIEALALCHNVTPTRDEEDGPITYQASSPDEVALVQFTDSIGLTLYERSFSTITLKDMTGGKSEYEILHVFPFSSETKRMGIIVRNADSRQIRFYMKGADVVMRTIVTQNFWMDEECGNMAREGLRTLVFGMRVMSEEEYEAFTEKLNEAKTAIKGRDGKVQSVVETIEHDLGLIGITGVEDKLQQNVRETLETLRNAGIKIWMLTGDKIETATNIAISARLVSRDQSIYTIAVETPEELSKHLEIFATKRDTALVIDGKSLEMCMDYHKDFFISTSCKVPSVVCCRCSPTQKAQVVTLIKDYTQKLTCAIGDGVGNDVSMIQAANVGIGIVGKEGKQASLAADFSINQFSFISHLIIWHGRNAYKRSASLGQFVIHRGLIISFIQAVFSALFFFAAVAVYNGWLLVGYATVFTNFPVFSLVLDTDITLEIATAYPELYKELQKGRALSYRTFFMWVFKSIYQGTVIMLVAIFLFENSMYNIVSITFTVLILTELLNIAIVIHTWHWMMVLCEVGTLILYLCAMVVLKSYFDMQFIMTWDFVWKTVAITVIAVLPVAVGKFVKLKFDPPAYSKLM